MANVHTTLVTTLPMLVLVACGSMQSYPEAPTEALDTGLEATGESDLDAGDDDDDDDASVVASIAVDAVQPTYGLDLGGEEVTILGGPFTENTTVLFGDDEAEVLSVDDDRLVVVTPSTTAEGHVDIIIRDGEAQGVMPEGYRFWRDATGKAGMVGTVAVVDLLGDYWGPNSNDFAYAELAAVEPAPYATWEQYAPRQNMCASNYSPPQLQRLDAVGSIATGATEVDLENDDGWLEADTDLQGGDSVSLSASGEEFETLDLDDLVVVPDGFELLRPSLDRPDFVPAPRQMELQWDVSNRGDYIAIVLEKVEVASDGTFTVKQTISCAVPDTGLYTVAGSLWEDWVSGDVVLVRMGRIRESQLTLPHNNADVAVTGAYWITGAVAVE